MSDDTRPLLVPLFRAHSTTTAVVFGDQPKGETKYEFRATYPDEEAAKKADADFRNDPEATRKQLAEQRRQLELKVRDADPQFEKGIWYLSDIYDRGVGGGRATLQHLAADLLGHALQGERAAWKKDLAAFHSWADLFGP